MKKSYLLKALALLSFISYSSLFLAQDTVEESIMVVGSQIKGASISDALPVSVYSNDDIEALGLDSGDELLEALVEQGQNEFAEASESGGINSSRGDIGAYNLRNIGGGNTLVLLNGRRLVSSPGFQTELIGGGFTPVSTVNSNLIPANSLDRVEILRDGASAIYGADAVAGVVNNVVDSNFEGMVLKVRKKNFNAFEDTEDASLSFKFGTDLERGNLTVNYDFVSKGNARARDHDVMRSGDLRGFLPGGTSDPYASFFDNTSSQSNYGQYDLKESGSKIKESMNAAGTRVNDSTVRGYIASDGEFLVMPDNHPSCLVPDDGTAKAPYYTGFGTCIVSNNGQSILPWNKNTYAWVRGETERHNLLINFDYDLDNGMNLYNEIAFYESEYYSERDLSTQYPRKLRVAAAHYYNPLRQLSPATIATNATNASTTAGVSPTAAWTNIVQLDNPDTAIFEGNYESDAELFIDNIRFGPLPKTVSVDKETWRFLQGFSGSFNDWDYDAAVVVSKATSDDISGNRIDALKMQKALSDPTPAGFNILCDWTRDDCQTNIEQTLVDVYKKQESELKMFDLKFTNANLFDLPAGPVGFLIGLEYREESYEDDRDDRLDGTIEYKHISQNTITSTGSGGNNCYIDLDASTGNDSYNSNGVPNDRGLAQIDANGNIIADSSSCYPVNYTFPYVGAVLGGSPTADSAAERDTESVFTEFSIPVLDNLDMQVAARYESTSDFGDELVGKFALGWQAHDTFLIRASASSTFKAPNLVAMNQEFLTRFNSNNTDYSKGISQDTSSYNSKWIYRRAEKNANLLAETSDNFSLGFVFEPADNLMIIADAYKIVKDDVVGNFGITNELALDFLKRWNARGYQGTAAPTAAYESSSAAITRCNASGYTGLNSRVARTAADSDDYDDLSTLATYYGLCPIGTVDLVTNQYENLAERTLEGFDLALYYDIDTDTGSWSFRYRGSYLTKLEQDVIPGSDAAVLTAAINDGTLSNALTALSATDKIGAVVIQGYGKLEGRDSIFEDKHSARVSYRLNDFSANLTAKHTGDYVQSAVVDSNGIPFKVDSFTTANLSLAYRFDVGDARVKATFGVNNIEDKTAPLADEAFGYDSDVHNGYGRSFYFDLRTSF
tara:strand:- start:102 stop:3482 length:3381 start_codon:yes stop_codon:yes gene_type:complete